MKPRFFLLLLLLLTFAASAPPVVNAADKQPRACQDISITEEGSCAAEPIAIKKAPAKRVRIIFNKEGIEKLEKTTRPKKNRSSSQNFSDDSIVQPPQQWERTVKNFEKSVQQ